MELHKRIIMRSKPVRFFTIFLLMLTLLTGCQNQGAITESGNQADNETGESTITNKESSTNAAIFYQDSTVYFAEESASISMRASFLNQLQEQGEQVIQPFAQGYRLQFRSLEEPPPSLGTVAIIAGGRKIELTGSSIIIPSKQGITFSISLENTRFISEQSDSVLQFKYQGESYFMLINDHRLSDFVVR